MLPDPGRFVSRLAEDLEKNRRFFLVVFSIVFLLCVCAEAAVKLLWYDELTTLYIDRQATLGQVLSLIYSGQDLNPPLFHILTHFSLRLFGENAVAIRLPEMLGFWTLCLCLYAFVARRTSALHGAIAMLVPLITSAYTYAYEARPYGIVLGFCGLALVSWQRSTEGRPRGGALTGLALSLAAALSNHFYAVLLYVPLGIGELVRWRRSGKPDFALWTALAVSLAPLFIFLRIIAMHSGEKSVFWAKANWMDVPAFYDFLLQPAAIPAAVLILMLTLAWKSAGVPAPKAATSGPYAHEMAAAIALALLPVAGMIMAKLYTGAFVARYTLAAVAGISLLVAFVPAIYEDSRRRLAAGLAVTLYGYFVVGQAFALPRYLSGPDDTLAKLTLPSGKTAADMPVAVSDGRVFLQMVHYCSPELRRRLYFLGDHDAALKYMGFTTVDDALPSMSQFIPMKVAPYRQFVAAHKQFQLYGPHGSAFDWNWARLVDDGAHLELQGRFGPYMLFQVALP